MKTTLEINDALLIRAKRLAERSGKPLSAIIEESLRHTLSRSPAKGRYEMPDLSVGNPDAPDPLEVLRWPDLRGQIYGETDYR